MIVNPALEQYMADLLPARDPVLAEMEAYAFAHQSRSSARVAPASWRNWF